MHDPLDAIRRLYGEPGEGLPTEGAELEAMAELKAALDRLPPCRPDPSVIDAVVAAAARPPVLEPIRAVYDEGAAELESESARAEARALAPVKEGLDALPRQRPDASLIDAVVQAAGAAQSAALAPVRTVYDEEPAPLASSAAEAEAAALAEMKAALDRLPPRRPDPSVIDAVVAAAAQPALPAEEQAEGRPGSVAAVAGRAADRPARRNAGETRRRVATVVGAVFAVVLVFGGWLWLSQEPASSDLAAVEQEVAGDQVAEAPPSAGAEAAEASEAPAPPPAETPAAAPDDDGLLAAASPPPQPTAEAEAGIAARPAAAPEATGAPSAFAARATAPAAGDVQLAQAMALDADDDLRLMYLRLREMQDGQAGLGWDTPPVALGAASDSTPAPPATGWMQVRVQR
jgi:hypothetical protein